MESYDTWPSMAGFYTYNDIFKAWPHWHICQTFTPFYNWMTFHLRIYHMLFIHFKLMDNCIFALDLRCIMVTRKFADKVLCKRMFSLPGKRPEVGLLGQRAAPSTSGNHQTGFQTGRMSSFPVSPTQIYSFNTAPLEAARSRIYTEGQRNQNSQIIRKRRNT